MPDLPRRATLLGLAGLATPRLAASQPVPPDAALAEPHVRVPEPIRLTPMPAGEQHRVAVWTRLLLGLTGGVVVLRAQATLHLAMHDAVNAAEPRFTRFMQPELDEPPAGAARAAPALAMAAAAATVLAAVHPSGASAAAPALASARAGVAPAAAAAAQSLGSAVGRAAVRRMEARAFGLIALEGERGVGRWRPTPPWYAPTQLMVYAPFIAQPGPALFGPGPHALGSAAYQRELAEVRAWGGARSTTRSEAQGELASWWVGRDLDRCAMLTAAVLMEARPGQLHEEARAMAQMAVAMADTYVVWAAAKRHFSFWRPVTAIRDGALPLTQAAGWLPYLPTPAHPEFPSGHAADITTGAVMLEALFPAARQPMVFEGEGVGGGQQKRYENASALAAECRESRLWAGAHFRSANEDGRRLGEAVSQLALAALPPLRG